MRMSGVLVVLFASLDCVSGWAEGFNSNQNTNSQTPGLQYDTSLKLSETSDVRAASVGQTVQNGTWEFEATAGAGYGIRDSRRYTHDVALTEFRVGRTITDVLGQGHWYEGDFELLGEFFVGAQFHPQSRYLVGVAPVARYNFLTGTRWVPFVDASAGLTATDIGHPDLGANFEFDLQGGPGVKYYFTDHTAFIFQYRYLHFSNAGLFPHNHGINVNTLLPGMGWAF